MNPRPILFVLGSLLVALAAGMMIPALVDAFVGNEDWQVFVVSAVATLFIGMSMMLANSARGQGLSTREAFLMTTLIWVVLPLFSALPFMFSTLQMTFTDAYFEAISGITTTGSTVISGLDSLPPGILLWRGILQWLGGLGVIVMTISLLPMLRVGGMQLFKVEAFDTQGRNLPRAAQISGGITVVYLALTGIWTLALYLAGMTGLDAVVHAMTTIATGGYSTHDLSIGHYDSTAIDWIVTAGMAVGGVPFLLILKEVTGHPGALARDQQVRAYALLLLAATLVCFLAVWLPGRMDAPIALRECAFTVVSIMTGTGFATTDYTQWGMLPVALVFFLTFIGGCAGSTACGIKVFRFQVLFAAANVQLRRLLQPHAVIVASYNQRPVSDEVFSSVLSFFFLFGVLFVLLVLGLSLLGLDFVTALSSAATAMANVGPGLGPVVGPAGNFLGLPDAAKWMLAAGMLLGRLELFTVLVLFTRGFWKG
ncbi:MAG: TrkH family potassium uptake protein [Hyphomicrobiales bacterium]|nr:TrkH family potassium uptake protein [Hyphomicrobiales bacterium]MCP5374417.1 TrkH family potassium uptake protein [Hyphomicrobiales bacterium]